MTGTLAIAGLSKTYPNGVRALDGVTLAIPPGMFGLLGPHGAATAFGPQKGASHAQVEVLAIGGFDEPV